MNVIWSKQNTLLNTIQFTLITKRVNRWLKIVRLRQSYIKRDQSSTIHTWQSYCILGKKLQGCTKCIIGTLLDEILADFLLSKWYHILASKTFIVVKTVYKKCTKSSNIRFMIIIKYCNNKWVNIRQCRKLAR